LGPAESSDGQSTVLRSGQCKRSKGVLLWSAVRRGAWECFLIVSAIIHMGQRLKPPRECSRYRNAEQRTTFTPALHARSATSSAGPWSRTKLPYLLPMGIAETRGRTSVQAWRSPGTILVLREGGVGSLRMKLFAKNFSYEGRCCCVSRRSRSRGTRATWKACILNLIQPRSFHSNVGSNSRA